MNPELTTHHEQPENRTAKNFERGLEMTFGLAEAKLKEKHSMVVILILGEPNAGKSTLKIALLKKVFRDSNDGINFNSRGETGFEEVEKQQQKNTEQNPTLPTEFLIVEGYGNIDLLKLQAQKLGLKVDIAVYIYNPDTTQYVSKSATSQADIIIENRDSVKKKL